MLSSQFNKGVEILEELRMDSLEEKLYAYGEDLLPTSPTASVKNSSRWEDGDLKSPINRLFKKIGSWSVDCLGWTDKPYYRMGCLAV
jgi:hypothetical protein